MRDDPTLQEDFELGGRFWLPQAPNEALGGAERNYLTHYPPGEPEPMSALECVHMAMRLRAFLTLLLLAEIGLTGQKAADGLRRARWHRYVT